MTMSFVAVKLPSQELAFTNFAYVSPKCHEWILANAPRSSIVFSNGVLCDVKGLVLTVMHNSAINDGQIGLNSCHREICRVQLKDEIKIDFFKLQKNNFLAESVKIQITTFAKLPSRVTVKDEELEIDCRKNFKGQVLSVNQLLSLKCGDSVDPFKLTILQIIPVDLEETQNERSKQSIRRGLITEHTEFEFLAAEDGRVAVHSKKAVHRDIFTSNFNFEELGIGGLSKEFTTIFRRVFSFRIFPPSLIAELGLPYVKGMLLHGPPGTGKTLIARQLGKALKAREPKIVNGPEVLNKYVGQSEENIRNLFKDAEEEYRKMGDNSALHIIIFDEIDAICKKRGTSSTSTGVNDSLVNQLLSKIDGVESLNNILLIGMTNRMDLIDEALLRPGRLEVLVEIGLPDKAGRLQILNIHTRSLKDSNRLEDDIDLLALAERTNNYSGAELQGLVKSAAAFGFMKKIDVKNLSKTPDMQSLKICKDDFEYALEEIKPAFGVEEDIIDFHLQKGIISFSEEFDNLLKNCITLSQKVRDSESCTILSLLLHGLPGSGKTAFAAQIAKLADFPFVKIITPEELGRYTESAKCAAIWNTFDDSYKSPLSLIILDDIERLIDFSPIGPRFSNAILQAIMVLVKKSPKKNSRRLFVIGTTSKFDFLKESDAARCFNVTREMPLVTGSAQLRKVLLARNENCGDFPVEEINKVCNAVDDRFAIKQLLLTIETAATFCKPDKINSQTLLECINEYDATDY